MLTLKLWRALRHPPYHNPVFRRIRGTYAAPSRIRQILTLLLGYFASCLIFSLIWPYLFAAPSLILALVIGAGNTLYGMVWAGGISAAIARERELKTYDLLALQPTGAFGVDWALSTGTLHRSALFRDLPAFVQVLASAFIGALLIVVALFALFTLIGETDEESIRLLLAAVQGIALAAAFYVDHIQSLVLANLVGMITPLYTPDRLNARLWAVGGFLLFKVAIYVLTMVINFVLLPRVMRILAFDGALASIGLALLQFGIFYQLQDAIIGLLWRYFVQPRQSEFTG